MSISSSPPIPLDWPFPARAKSPDPASEPTRRPRRTAARPEGADRSGELLDNQWELRRRLGAGGMGEVYHALYHADRRAYAVKILASKYAADPTAYARFLHEFMVLRRSAHPHIVAAHAFVERAGECFYSMELLDGEPLNQMIKSGPLPVERVVLIGIQLCRAVGFLHDLGVVHRDLKPANIIVMQEGGVDHVKLLDLGVCKLTPRWYAGLEVRTEVDKRVQTQAGVALGTPGYMVDDGDDVASEVLADVFGLGATLFRIATGHMPYENSRPRAGDELRWTATDEERIPRVLAEVLRKAVAVDPAVRYQAVAPDPMIETLSDGLEQAAMEMGVIPCTEVDPPGEARRPALSAGAAIVDAAAAIVPAIDPAGESSLVPPLRRSTGWTVAAILGLYIFIDLIVRFGHVDGERPSSAAPMVATERIGEERQVVDAPPPERMPPSATVESPSSATRADNITEAVDPPAPVVSEINPPTTAVVAGANKNPPTTALDEDTTRSPPRSRQRLTAAGFRRIVEHKRAALARCAHPLRDGPAVDVVVRVSAEGSATGVRLTPDRSFLAESCAAEVFEGLDFPPTDAASTHTWPLHRPKE